MLPGAQATGKRWPYYTRYVHTQGKTMEGDVTYIVGSSLAGGLERVANLRCVFQRGRGYGFEKDIASLHAGVHALCVALHGAAGGMRYFAVGYFKRDGNAQSGRLAQGAGRG